MGSNVRSQLKVASPFRILCDEVSFENDLTPLSRSCRKALIYTLSPNSPQKVVTDREDMDDQRSREESFELAKDQAFRGTVKLWIRHFSPEGPLTNPRQFDPKNLSRLIQIFKLEGCLRLASEHHVPVVVRRHDLDDALRTDQTSFDALRSAQEPQFLSLRTGVTYLQGAHRLEAGQRFLHPDDRWWVADLYLEELESTSRLAATRL